MTPLSDILARLKTAAATMLGFPLNLAPQPLDAIPWSQPINNLGDPYAGAALGTTTFDAEREVVGYFADLFGLPALDAWGYVTSGGTEGNYRGISFGQQKLAHAVLYASEAAHYSVWKWALFSGATLVKVRANQWGALDCDDFAAKLDRTRPAVLCLTAGTTMTGAVDDIRHACAILENVPSYVHVDAALFGLTLPFFEECLSWDFRVPRVDSISVSGHKMLGAPQPCGVFVARKSAKTSADVEYIGSPDSTILGSRSGHAPLVLRELLEKVGEYRLGVRAHHCAERAAWACERIPGAWRNPMSPIVVFPKPSPAVCEKWQLAHEGDVAHLIVMPHVTHEMLTNFIEELKGCS